MSASVSSPPPAVAALGPFAEAGLLEPVDLHLAATLARLGGESSPDVLLGAALASRAPRHGHVCVDLRRVAEDVPLERADPAEQATLPWPSPDAWIASLGASTVVAPPDAPDDDPRPLVLDRFRLYLDRLWRDERFVAAELLRRAVITVDDWGDELGRALDEQFPSDPDAPGTDLQRRAATMVLSRSLTVVAGGPGTGKTRTLARVIAALRRRPGPRLRIALAAPTGKAAARMGEAVHQELARAGAAELTGELQPQTLHRLLGIGGRRHRAAPRLTADLVIVDESSMVSLPLMAELLRALPDATRLVLVGDPDQLTSVEAGTVLADIVSGSLDERDGPLTSSIVVLQRPYRFTAESDIKPLADAVRAGDRTTTRRLLAGERGVRFVESEDPLLTPDGAGLRPLLVEAASTTFAHAARGDAAAALASTRAVRLLCAHRRGHHGVEEWNRLVERWLAADVEEFSADERWYVGRPVLLTRNDPVTHTNNGDVGVVVVEHGEAESRRLVAVEAPDGARTFRPAQLPETETFHAMTIHKSQGSEFDGVVVLLPPAASRLATRELLYTAVTRARHRLVVVGTWAALDAALGRRVSRASGLGDALWPVDAGAGQLQLF